MKMGGPPTRRRFFSWNGLAAATGIAVLTGASTDVLAQQAGGGEFAWGDALKRIKAAGKVVFAQSGSPTPPLYSPDPSTKKPVGYDVEIANLIARDLGVEPVFEEAGVAARISGVQAGKYDIGLGATANIPSRANLVSFTRGYLPYHQVLLINSATAIRTALDLNDPKYVMTVAAHSTAEDTARLIFPHATLKPVPITEAVQQVVSGAANACLIELYLVAPLVRSQPSIKIFGTADRPAIIATEYGCMFCRNSDLALHQWLDNWLYWYETHGVLAAMYNRIMNPAVPWAPLL